MTSDSTSVYKEFKCVITVEDQRLKSKRLALNFEEKWNGMVVVLNLGKYIS